MRKCKIGIVGFGTVGSGIYKILSSEFDSHPILKEIETVSYTHLPSPRDS